MANTLTAEAEELMAASPTGLAVAPAKTSLMAEAEALMRQQNDPTGLQPAPAAASGSLMAEAEALMGSGQGPVAPVEQPPGVDTLGMLPGVGDIATYPSEQQPEETSPEHRQRMGLPPEEYENVGGPWELVRDEGEAWDAYLERSRTKPERDKQDAAILKKRDPVSVDNKAKYARSVLLGLSQQYPDAIPPAKLGVFYDAVTLWDKWIDSHPEDASKADYSQIEEWKSKVIGATADRLLDDPESGKVPLDPVSSLDEAMVAVKLYPRGHEIKRGIVRRFPFSPYKAWESGRIFNAVRAIKAGKAEPEDWTIIAWSLDEAERAEDWGTLRNIADAVSELPAYGVEIGLTGGIYTSVKVASAKVAQRALPKITATAVGKTELPWGLAYRPLLRRRRRSTTEPPKRS